MLELCPLKFALAELFAQVSDHGRLTLADRYGLLANLLHEDSLTEDERHSIDRLLRATLRGRVKVDPEISILLAGS
ncbi:MAG: hypothetical protein O2890_11735 [Cyanobacteria bacterium]|nr:hypothetical protein [Cyanobacteriota bacterium]MDA0867064.1 hypothetical protein [Cyanobacteriota bacterium]